MVTTRGSRFGALRSRNFSLLWFGLIISNSGSWMQLIAQGWLVYDLSRSPFMLGVVGVSRALPMILLPPIGGAIADRVPRIKLLKVTQWTNLALALPLPFLVFAGRAEVWHVIVLGVLSGMVNAFDQPTRQALVPDLVQKEQMTSAIALNSAAWQGSSLIGPAIAGVIIAALGLGTAFLLNALSFLAVIGALYLMRGVPERSSNTQRRGLFADVVGGLHYASTTRFVATLLLLSAVASIFGRSYQQLLPAFARDVLHQDSTGLGLMTSMPGAGTMIAAVILSSMGDIRRKGTLLLVAMGLFSAAVVSFAISRSLNLTFVLLFFAGVTNFLFMTMTQTMLQLYVPGEMRGRVMALVSVSAQGFAPFGALIVGGLAEVIGTQRAVAGSAVVVGIAALYALLTAPAIRAFDSDEHLRRREVAEAAAGLAR